MDEQVKIEGFAPWQNSGAYNTYYTYQRSGRQTFYAMINPRYFGFVNRSVRNWLAWYDGYVPYFHRPYNGIFSTHLAQALVNRISDKVVGGRLMFKNAGEETHKKGVNPSLKYVSEWAKDTNFNAIVRQAITYACAGGTALLKANKDSKGLWCEALRFDGFIPTVDFRGNVTKVICYLQQYADLRQGHGYENYYLIEERYFTDYETHKNGYTVVLKNRPVVKYSIKRAKGVVGEAEDYSNVAFSNVDFKTLPKAVRNSILDGYGAYRFDTEILLPFKDWLGVELVKWTDYVSNIPQLPFGESLLAPLQGYLQTYDYYYSAFATDMYTGRARVLVPSYMQPKKKQTNYNDGLDTYLYTQVPSPNPEKGQPTPLQFNLRATEWATIRDTIIQNIAVNIGVNISTLAGFMTDNNARTAREVSTEENETAGYVNTKREILEKPFNRFIKRLLRFNGYEDDVVLRWSAAGLTNRQSLVEFVATALGANAMSTEKAVQMLNYDDDETQVDEELQKVLKQKETQPFGDFNEPMGDEPFGLGDEH